MNRIIIHCGDGRGKSSSAFGIAVRSLAHNKKVLAAQFFKPAEDAALKYLLRTASELLTVKNYGNWFFVDRPDEKAAEIYRDALVEIKELIQTNDFDTVVLDEVFYAVNFGLLEVENIVDLINCFDGKCFVLTGRNAPLELLEMADTVSCIKCEKHAFDKGIKAQKGVEF